MDINLSLHIPIPSIPLILGFVVLVNLALAWRTWVSDKKNPVNIYFAAMVLMVALWSFGLSMSLFISSPFWLSVWTRILYVAAAMISPFFYLFTYHFPYKTYHLQRRYYYVLFISTFFILSIIVLPDIFISGYILPQQHLKPEVSLFWHIVFGVYFTSWMCLAFYNLLSKRRISDGIWRVRLKQVIVATIVAFIGGSIFSLFIPIVYNNFLAWIGPLFTLFMAVYIWYHIFWIPGRVPKSHR